MESFDIDAFLSQTFKDMEEKEKSKEKKKKAKNKKIIQENKNDKQEKDNNNKMIIENIDKEKINIFNENKIDMKIYNKINLEETQTEKNLQIKNIIKPLFPNDDVFQKEFTSDKVYLIDKFINRSNKKNKKKQMKLNYTHNMIKSLKKEKLNYEELLSMNKLWQDYIKDLMNNSNNEENILSKMLKADLHGAILTVINSTNKNNIGITGIVLFESRRTFNLLCYMRQEHVIQTVFKRAGAETPGRVFAPVDGTVARF